MRVPGGKLVNLRELAPMPLLCIYPPIAIYLPLEVVEG